MQGSSIANRLFKEQLSSCANPPCTTPRADLRSLAPPLRADGVPTYPRQLDYRARLSSMTHMLRLVPGHRAAAAVEKARQTAPSPPGQCCRQRRSSSMSPHSGSCCPGGRGSDRQQSRRWKQLGRRWGWCCRAGCTPTGPVVGSPCGTRLHTAQARPTSGWQGVLGSVGYVLHY